MRKRYMAPVYRLLENFKLVRSTDVVKRPLELTCLKCGAHVCDAEADDLMDVLARACVIHSGSCDRANDP